MLVATVNSNKYNALLKRLPIQ